MPAAGATIDIAPLGALEGVEAAERPGELVLRPWVSTCSPCLQEYCERARCLA